MNVFPFLTLKSETKYLLSDDTVRQGIEKMDHYRFSTIPILDDQGRYIGTLSEGDLLHYIHATSDFQLRNGEDVLISSLDRRRSYKSLSMDSTLDELVNLAMEQNFIPVVDDRKVFMGIIRRRTILEFFRGQLKDSLEEVL
ncbi:MAG: CBS domain-containing protein [Candidatus Enteromonas sp.]